MNCKLLHIALLIFLTFELSAQFDRDSTNLNFINSHVETLQLYQSEKFRNEEIYRIWFDDYQVVELVSIEENQVIGQLINYVTKISRNKKKNKIISQSLKIPDNSAKRLFQKFKEERIETLPDCRDIDGYIFGCDGNSVTFEIKTPKNQRSYYYWEPEFVNYQDSTNINVLAVRQILIELNKDINRSQLFNNFTQTLGKGRYKYGMIIMTIK